MALVAPTFWVVKTEPTFPRLIMISTYNTVLWAKSVAKVARFTFYFTATWIPEMFTKKLLNIKKLQLALISENATFVTSFTHIISFSWRLPNVMMIKQSPGSSLVFLLFQSALIDVLMGKPAYISIQFIKLYIDSRGNVSLFWR